MVAESTNIGVKGGVTTASIVAVLEQQSTNNGGVV
jgi:hypothetical protein